MRRGQGWLTTLIMLVPMTAVPMMAVFGIPQFAPVSASPAPVERELAAFDFRENRVGHSDSYPLPPLDLAESRDRFNVRGSSGVDRVDPRDDGTVHDLFAPLDGRAVSEPAAVAVSANTARHVWSDPLAYSSLSPETRRVGSSGVGSSGSDRREDMPDVFGPRNRQSEQRDASDLQQTSLASRVSQADSRSSLGRISGDQSSVSDFRYSRIGAGENRLSGARSNSESASTEFTWTTAIDELNAEGVHNYRLTPGAQPGVFRFMCFVTSVESPRVSRRFDAEAGDPLEAVQQVLAQVADWNRAQ
jgi:hypothetical protein